MRCPFLLVMVAFGAIAQAGPEHHVITPDQEAVVGPMMGMGSDPVGGCALERASIDRAVIVATYRCPGGAVPEVTLHHPDDPVRAVTSTAQFKLVLRGEPPAGFVPALAARIRAAEGGFRWQAVGAAAKAASAPAGPPTWVLWAAMGLGLVVAVGAGAWYRRGQR